jgi:hypothetical protein
MMTVLAIGMFAAIAAAQSNLPALRVEAVDNGSLLFVKNQGTQPITAFLIELVDYPGSSFVYQYDELAEAVAPGVEKRIHVTNMLPGAVPDYVKLQAAIFADGSTAGAADKVSRLVDWRRATLETTREAMRRMAAGTEKSAIIVELRKWAESLRPGPARTVAAGAVARLERGTVAEELERLRRSEALLAQSKPRL